MRKSVVVTGASTGIGRAAVAELVKAGFHVWPTVRRTQDAESLRDEHRDAVEPLLLDVTDTDAVRAAGEKVRASGPLHGLVNNAGAVLPGPLEYQPIEEFRKQLEINLVGQLAMTQAMLPALRLARAEGEDARIVIIGSIGGRLSGPIIGAYQATKHGVAGLAGSLRAELAPSGIRVILIEPGAIRTPIWERATAASEEMLAAIPPEGRARYERQIAGARALADRGAARGLLPERAGRSVVKALTARNPRPRQVLGPDAQVAAFLVRVLPHRMLYRLAAGH